LRSANSLASRVSLGARVLEDIQALSLLVGSRNNKSQSFSLSFPNRREWCCWLDWLDIDQFAVASSDFDGCASRDQCG
jgi:hypothetical protein